MGIADNTAMAANVSGSIIRSYEEMELPAKYYVLGVLVPAFVFFLATFVVAFLLDVFLFVRLLVPILGLLVFATALGYPRLAVDSRRSAGFFGPRACVAR